MIKQGEIRNGKSKLVVHGEEGTNNKIIHVICPAGDGYIGLDVDALEKLKELLFPS